MLFPSVAAIFFGLLSAHAVVAQLTPAQVVVNINIVTKVSGDLNGIMTGVTTSMSPQQVITISQTAVAQFQVIINSLSADVTAMRATPAYPDTVTGPIITALTTFVEVHQLLLSTVIGRHAIFAQFGVTAPIAAVLRTLEAGIDTFAFALIDLIPTQTPTVTNDKNGLDQSVGSTIKIYTQICIPSVLFPILQPTCVAL